MFRVSLKITGAQGQGINSVGEMCARGLRRAGYRVFGYREYASVIKGGHSSYQLDVSGEAVSSSEESVDLLACLNHHGIAKNVRDLKKGGVLLHQTPQWKFCAEDEAFIRENGVRVLYVPAEDILRRLGAKPVLGNVLITAVVWAVLGRPLEELQAIVAEQFGHKKELLALNEACIREGTVLARSTDIGSPLALPKSGASNVGCCLLTGSQAMGLGTIRAGCRAFFSYPMTPATSLLTFIADTQSETGMIVKQAEDEITAAQMMVGAMHMGTRAATATSGGGYDLMTETVSMCGIAEAPALFVLAQRPGPGTGLPTWSAQGDLLMAAGCGHGEFPRLVMGVSDAADSFSLMADAFNYAEEFQLPVTVLTDKHVAESLFTAEIGNGIPEIRRGRLVTDPAGLVALKSVDRYDPDVPDGVSVRWLPGSRAATYCTQSYEHAPDGSFAESAENTQAQMEKRMRKMEALREALPEPELYVADGNAIRAESGRPQYQGDPEPVQARFGARARYGAQREAGSIDTLLVSWGSNKGVILDTMEELRKAGKKGIGYLHFTYLWPMKTERFMTLAGKAKRMVLIECNAQGQLGMLLKQETGVGFSERMLKYDGRPFFFNELKALLLHHPKQTSP